MNAMNQIFIQNAKNLYEKKEGCDRDAGGQIMHFFLSFVVISVILYICREINDHYHLVSLPIKIAPELQLVGCSVFAIGVMLYKQMKAKKKYVFYKNEADLLEDVNVKNFIKEYYLNEKFAERVSTIMYEDYCNRLLKKELRNFYRNGLDADKITEIENKIKSGVLMENPVNLVGFLVANRLK